jgi:hypothetical protein
VRPGSPWCTLCYTDLRPAPLPDPIPEPEPSYGAYAAFAAGASSASELGAFDPLTAPLALVEAMASGAVQALQTRPIMAAGPEAFAPAFAGPETLVPTFAGPDTFVPTFAGPDTFVPTFAGPETFAATFAGPASVAAPAALDAVPPTTPDAQLGPAGQQPAGWPCSGCETLVSFEETSCPACGTSFLAGSAGEPDLVERIARRGVSKGVQAVIIGGGAFLIIIVVLGLLYVLSLFL